MIFDKIKKMILLGLFSLLYSGTLRAEYRVYQYYVKSKTPRLDDQKPYLVTSTLDPISYLAYHGGNQSIKIDLLRTWPCHGYTGGNKEICKGPLESSLAGVKTRP